MSMILSPTLTIAILATALLVAVVIIFIGIIRYARATDQQTQALSEIEQTISHATRAIRSGFKTVRRKIEHSDELTGQKRREMIQLILDSERRCMDMIRDLGHQLAMQGIKVPPNVTVQNSTGGGAANQAGNNHHE